MFLYNDSESYCTVEATMLIFKLKLHCIPILLHRIQKIRLQAIYMGFDGVRRVIAFGQGQKTRRKWKSEKA